MQSQPENEEELQKELQQAIEKANADAATSAAKETFDKSTVVAFGLLFVLPALVIVLSMIFLLPLVAHIMDDDPSGTLSQPNTGSISPSGR